MEKRKSGSSRKKGAWLTLILDGGSTRRVRGTVEMLREVADEEGSEAEVTELEGGEEGDEHERLMLIKPDHSRYIKGLGVTTAGNQTYDVNDYVAEVLRGQHIKDVFENVARAHAAVHGGTGKAALEDFHNRYDGLKTKSGSPNYGMMRMNLGNRLRALVKAAQEEGIELPDIQ